MAKILKKRFYNERNEKILNEREKQGKKIKFL